MTRITYLLALTFAVLIAVFAAAAQHRPLASAGVPSESESLAELHRAMQSSSKSAPLAVTGKAFGSPGSPGTGYRPPAGATACHDSLQRGVPNLYRPMDLSAQPWGPTGYDQAAFERRYCGGEGECPAPRRIPCGAWGEAVSWNWWAQMDCAGWGLDTCRLPEPTEQEAYDYAFAGPGRCSSTYQRRFRLGAGGTPATAEVVTADNWRQRGWMAELAGACRPGVHSYTHALCNWPAYVRLESWAPGALTWCSSPAPVPDPPPTAEPRGCKEIRQAQDDLSAAEVRLQCPSVESTGRLAS